MQLINSMECKGIEFRRFLSEMHFLWLTLLTLFEG